MQAKERGWVAVELGRLAVIPRDGIYDLLPAGPDVEIRGIIEDAGLAQSRAGVPRTKGPPSNFVAYEREEDEPAH